MSDETWTATIRSDGTIEGESNLAVYDIREIAEKDAAIATLTAKIEQAKVHLKHCKTAMALEVLSDE